jgi:hypothetical protein
MIELSWMLVDRLGRANVQARMALSLPGRDYANS